MPWITIHEKPPFLSSSMIEVQNLTVQVGNFRLHNASFAVEAAQYCVLMGRTGSGKTTVLECICGLREAQSGTIRLGGMDVTDLRPAERGIGYVPQDGALFNTMTVRQNLTFPLQIRRWKSTQITSRTEELASVLGIGHLLDRKPSGLSGGEAQRVALGRALSFHPDVLILDEPLSALDDETRYQMYDLLKAIQHRYAVTMLHVTHSREAASHLADRLFRIENGQIAEIEDADTVYAEPVDNVTEEDVAEESRST